MTQEDYDQGHEDGRESAQPLIDAAAAEAEYYRQQWEAERAETKRLRGLLHPPLAGSGGDIPF